MALNIILYSKTIVFSSKMVPPIDKKKAIPVVNSGKGPMQIFLKKNHRKKNYFVGKVHKVILLIFCG